MRGEVGVARRRKSAPLMLTPPHDPRDGRTLPPAGRRRARRARRAGLGARKRIKVTLPGAATDACSASAAVVRDFFRVFQDPDLDSAGDLRRLCVR